MAKFFLLIVLVVLVVWLFRRSAPKRQDAARQGGPRPEELMVTCAWCGVNQPVSESILTDGRYYCCAEHRQAADSRNT